MDLGKGLGMDAIGKDAVFLPLGKTHSFSDKPVMLAYGKSLLFPGRNTTQKRTRVFRKRSRPCPANTQKRMTDIY